MFSIILTFYLAILTHEYAHATMAWIFGYKSSPFDIQYGSWYLVPVSEAVDYARILSSGHGVQEALIGISGIFSTFILFIVSILFLNWNFIKRNNLLLSLFFWLASINLMEMFSYLNRTFVMGDIGEFIQGLNISPLWIFIPSIVIVGLGLYRFYRYELIKMYLLLPIKRTLFRRVFLWMTFWTLPLSLIYWGPTMDTNWQLVSNLTNIFSILVVLTILIIYDPSRNRIKNLSKVR